MKLDRNEKVKTVTALVFTRALAGLPVCIYCNCTSVANADWPQSVYEHIGSWWRNSCCFGWCYFTDVVVMETDCFYHAAHNRPMAPTHNSLHEYIYKGEI